MSIERHSPCRPILCMQRFAMAGIIYQETTPDLSWLWCGFLFEIWSSINYGCVSCRLNRASGNILESHMKLMPLILYIPLFGRLLTFCQARMPLLLFLRSFVSIAVASVCGRLLVMQHLKPYVCSAVTFDALLAFAIVKKATRPKVSCSPVRDNSADWLQTILRGRFLVKIVVARHSLANNGKSSSEGGGRCFLRCSFHGQGKPM